MRFINKATQGFGIIEIIVAVGIFFIVAVTGVSTVTHSFSTNRLSDEETQATLFAQEGIEAARSIRGQGWTTPFLATDCTSGCGVDASSGTWTWSGSSDTVSIATGRDFTRTILVEQMQRDSNENIVSSGGTADGDTYRITSTVEWDFTPTRNNTVELVSYVTQFSKQIGGSPTPTVSPSPTGTPSPTPTITNTPTPTTVPTTCAQYCLGLGYSAGTCRQNTNQCTNNAETYESGGDGYCTGGPSADTCCCAP